MNLTGKLDGRRHSFQLATSAPPLCITDTQEPERGNSLCGRSGPTLQLVGPISQGKINTPALPTHKTYPPSNKLFIMTAVGFKPTPFRNGAWSHRLRPLGQTVLELSCHTCAAVTWPVHMHTSHASFQGQSSHHPNHVPALMTYSVQGRSPLQNACRIAASFSAPAVLMCFRNCLIILSVRSHL